VDTEEDAGAGFRLAGAAHDDVRGADLRDTELGGGDIVAIETASRLHPAASVHAVVRDLILRRTMVKELDQSILSAEADRKVAS
jgi:hypothetical protein